MDSPLLHVNAGDCQITLASLQEINGQQVWLSVWLFLCLFSNSLTPDVSLSVSETIVFLIFSKLLSSRVGIYLKVRCKKAHVFMLYFFDLIE